MRYQCVILCVNMVKTYTIQIIPPAKVQETVYQLRNLIPSHDGGHWNTETPHITLQEAFRTRSINSLHEELEEIVTSHHPIRIYWNGPTVFSTNALVVEAKKNDGLIRLHENIVETVRRFRTTYCSPLYNREGYREAHFLEPQYFGYLYLYGMPFALQFYNPHMSVGFQLSTPFIKSAIEFLSHHPLRPWTAEEVVIACKPRQQEGYAPVYRIPLLGKINSHP